MVADHTVLHSGSLVSISGYTAVEAQQKLRDVDYVNYW